MKRAALLLLLLSLAAGLSVPARAARNSSDDDSRMKASTFKGLALRGIGPAFNSGRVADIAVDPADHATWYVAVASGGVWKTVNTGITWEAVFDTAGSYSIGCVTIDPNDPLTVWVGTGENNSQRSVGYGDGVYKSVDGGRGWKRMGLVESEHIGRILVDPRDSDVVFVAAQGPLWRDGGDRGLYRTLDGGETWDCVLEISPVTGVSDVVMDPRNPDVMYASAYQRQRHVWALIDGGPESGIYKTTDGGETWTQLTNGLPSGDVGRIGLALAPTEPDWIYAIVEAAEDKGGFFRSTDAGGNWEKRSDYVSGSPQYYQELYVDPRDPTRVYSMDTIMQVTEDGGKTFSRMPREFKHVDNHALWIDPEDTDHLVAGCDGGVYETFDRGENWGFKANLPVTQFYKIEVDNGKPFYNVYGGTQDNNTLGGPSRTNTIHGIVNSDWYVTVGGDGFQSRIDPDNPDIVYSQWQYGGLIRFDRKSGEEVDIRPQHEPNEAPDRWNWDAPLVLSPHAPTRLYFGSQRVYRSDDRGNSWTQISGDLTRHLDRNKLKIMGRVWSVDAVAKNRSTSFYGTLVALDESPLAEGLIYAGSDDGLIQVTEDGGATWRKDEDFPGVPELSYVSRITASLHDAGTVYASFDNHKMGDFKPYLLKSTNRGRSWKSIAGDLPERGTVYSVVEDHVNPDLLFAGTEFGVFFTTDGGKHWVQLEGGIPVIAVRDLAIQRRENDLVVGTFGRGFYILDDYSALRGVNEDLLDADAVLFGVKDPWMYIPARPWGGSKKGSQGQAFFAAPNPPFGAVFTYYLAEDIRTRREARREREKDLEKEDKDVFYPPWDSLRVEAREEAPTILLTVTDADGQVVSRVEGPVKKGFHRVAWNLRYPSPEPVLLNGPPRSPWADPAIGPMVAPGVYTVSMAKRVDGAVTPLGEPQEFEARPLGNATLPAADREAVLVFQRSTARLQRAVLGAVQAGREARTRLDHLVEALDVTPGEHPELNARARSLRESLADMMTELTGDAVVRKYNEPTALSIRERVQRIVGGQWQSTSEIPGTHRRAYEIAAEQFGELLPQLDKLIEVDLRALEKDADKAGVPWTPGRVPEWKPE